jgi:hypothetical protein
MLAHVRLPVVASLLLALAAQAQEQPPPDGSKELQDGERWRTSLRLVTSEVPVGQDQAQADTTTIAWTESSQALARPHGFALRSALVDYRVEINGPNARTAVAYGAEDLRRLGCDQPWTVELDPTWRVLDISGPHAPGDARRAALREARGEEEGDHDGCALRGWFGRRARGDGGWHVRMTNEHLAPVRVVMARLGGGAAIEEGFTARVEAAGFLPAGEVRFTGEGEGGSTFQVIFDVQGTDLPAPAYSFAIDEAGRLTRLHATGSWVRDGVRHTREYAWALEEVTPPGVTEETPSRPAPEIDASDRPDDMGSSYPGEAPTPQVGGDVGAERDGAEQPGASPQRRY